MRKFPVIQMFQMELRHSKLTQKILSSREFRQPLAIYKFLPRGSNAGTLMYK
jgi:hypothetical protein